MVVRKIMAGFILLLFNTSIFASDISVCFTPGQNCTQQIVTVINQTQKTLFVQAYQFTSAPIARAVVLAKQRGVDVKLILDKSQYNRNKYSPAAFFEHEGIPVWIDYKPNIAHNKIMVSDNTKIITGSFNFSKNAQDRNAENLLIITDPDLASKYTSNFNQRLLFSDNLTNYILASWKSGERPKHHHPRKHYRNDVL
jgi:phosphatidylserine/phosphatidylglycerophosphate/cardiolipin synthase-like enzyme